MRGMLLEDLEVEIHLPKEGQDRRQGIEVPGQARAWHPVRHCSQLHREPARGGQEGTSRESRPRAFPWPRSLRLPQRQKTRHIAPDPEHGPVIQRMFELYSSGRHSLAELRKITKAETGRMWPKSHLERMLKNPVYGGPVLSGMAERAG
jgi:hypothetical protein